MKLVRVLFLLLMIQATALPLLPRTADAAHREGAGTAVEDGGATDAGSETTTTSRIVIKPFTKGGVTAGVGCGFAIASMIMMPNPVSAFIIGFDCGLMLIDAGYSPDR